ncbi:uncharacterized protein LOC110980809 [Acanthaster planci]|uniref:Uncharacterized protein LOC110980809 n=1 Tax=Acanthaster planci TaxID=133434 RepID=A0A8B7YJR8_ACAPL|nr:uncharacterized protein LOC110980809 [Acanthaster planci]
MSVWQKGLKNIRSPRSTAAMLEHLPQTVIDRLAAKHPAKLTKVPVADGRYEEKELSEWLWESSQVQAQLALHTKFIQGIKSGLLDPTDYGGYTVQDAVYCSNATTYYGIAEDKSQDEIMKAFIQSRVKSYTSYTKVMFKQWHIRDPSGVAMGAAAASYSAFEKGVAENCEPIYLLIAMLPCEKLWEWLAEQIQSGISETNVYSFWITDNLGGSSKLAHFIDAYADEYGVDLQKAKDIYHGAMQGEVNFFASATAEVP